MLTLALGIGANTAIFSVINAVLLRPLPFHEPDRLVRLFETEAAPGNYPFTGPDYLDWQAQNRTLEAIVALHLVPPRQRQRRRAARVGLGRGRGGRLLRRAGRPAAARADASFAARAPGGARVAVLSYGFWQRHFGGDRAMVDRPIELDSERYTVVGVMPSWFNYPRDAEIWTPLDMSPQNLGSRGSHSYLAIGRLKPGVTVSQALADLSVIARRLEKQYPDSNEKVGAAVVPMQEQLTGSSREPLLILLGAVALVLLVACANVANLLLIRAGGRRRELAIRAALGAGRWRVVRQLLTESVLLALAGGAAGLAAAWWGVRLLQSAKSLPIPLVNPIRVDTSVLLFTLAAALVTGLLFGILPALQASAMRPGEELKSSSHAMLGTGARARRLRDGIAVAEIALSLALLVGAGLLLRSFDNMRHAEIGADTRNVLTMAINLPATRYATPVARRAFFDRLLERVRSSPGVQAAAASTQIPLEGGSNGYITVPGQDPARLKNQLFEWNYVTPDYFRAFGIPLLQGRNFAQQDEDQAAEVAQKLDEIFSAPNPTPAAVKGLSWHAVVNRAMARLVWPKEDPIGKTFVIGGALTVQVIGVAADVKARGIRSEVVPQAYLPFAGALERPGIQPLPRGEDGGRADGAAPVRPRARRRARLHARRHPAAHDGRRHRRRHGGHQPANVAAGDLRRPGRRARRRRPVQRHGVPRRAAEARDWDPDGARRRRAGSAAARPRPRRQARGRRPARRRVRRALAHPADARPAVRRRRERPLDLRGGVLAAGPHRACRLRDSRPPGDAREPHRRATVRIERARRESASSTDAATKGASEGDYLPTNRFVSTQGLTVELFTGHGSRGRNGRLFALISSQG